MCFKRTQATAKAATLAGTAVLMFATSQHGLAQDIIDETGRDIQLLSFRSLTGEAHGNVGDARVPALGGLPLERDLCTPTPTEGVVDCQKEVSELTGLPLASSFLLGERSGKCELLEVSTIITSDAFSSENFRGIGLYLGGTTGGKGQWISRDELQLQFDHRQNGLPYLEHVFLVQGMCFGQGGNSGSIWNRSFQVKPYAVFDSQESHLLYFKWEDTLQNHEISPGRTESGQANINRRPELLDAWTGH